MNQLYPLKFNPIFKDKIWGGQKIKTVLGLDFAPLPNCGEVWVVSGVEGNQSVISNGFLAGNELNEIVEVYMGDLVGDKTYERFGNEFPVLIKFIDANDWLSIQVHPDDELAMKRHGCLGKTEMWYLLDAEKDSQLISGFKTKVDRDSYQNQLENNTLESVLNYENVKKGDVFFMPAGRVHALGPGVLLAEIQQTSDVTYRIFDWNRIDQNGLTRELHTELALEAIDFSVQKDYKTHYKSKVNSTTNLVESSYFTTGFLQISEPMKKDYTEMDSCVIYICTEGSSFFLHNEEKYTLKLGEAMLIPASIHSLVIHPENRCSLLEVFLA